MTIAHRKQVSGFPPGALWKGITRFAAIAASVLAYGTSSSTEASSPESLHERVDGLLAEAHPEGQAPIVGDADFLRRAYLALHGVIPTAERARVFFADRSPAKRAKLVEELLGELQFAKWMAVRFDLMLMERRGEGQTIALPWREWLEKSFTENKPWNLLVSEILTPDGGEEKTRHLARWLLEREADQNTLAKDAARLFLGKDMACAQCHDHPRIDDYLQRDYAGLQAFFSRTYLFRPDEAKPGSVGEQASGETNYTSVFTKVGGETRPRLISEAEVNEPMGGEWIVPPDPKNKALRPIPKQSRRALLAEAFRDGKNPAFRRNIANRLWALVFGRGLVEPLDLNHSANPPANPALLDLLAEEIAATNFDMKGFIHELALTDAFQRTLDVPELPGDVPNRIQQKAVALELQARDLAAALAAAEAEANKAQKAMLQVQRAAEPLRTEKAKQDSAAAEVKKTVDAAVAERKKSAEALAAKQDVQIALAEAAAKIQEAIALAGEKSELTSAAKTFGTKAEVTANEIPGIEKELSEKATAAETKAEALTAAQAVVAKAKAKLDEALQGVEAQQSVFDAAEMRKEAERVKARHATALAAEVKAAVALSEAVALDKPAREAALKAASDLAARKRIAASLSAQLETEKHTLALLEATASSATAEMAKAKQSMTAKGPVLSALTEASSKAVAAATKLSKDEELKSAATAVKALADVAAAELLALQKVVRDAEANSQCAADEIERANAAAGEAAAELAKLEPQIAVLEAEFQTAETKAVATAKAVESARETLSLAWTRTFAASDLLPLSPEQLCWSVMQACGQFEPLRTAATNEWDAKNKPSEADPNDPAKVAARADGIEKLYREKIRGYEAQFVRCFGGAPGQPQTEFFATPEQALYFENAGVVRSWAAALATRVATVSNPAGMAEELYLAALTRMPSAAEVEEVSKTLASIAPEKKVQALTDLTWALLTSVEFRFSH